MATIKTRINITADADVEEALRRSAKRENMPVAAKAAEFLRLALEIEEDLMLASVADQRFKSSRRFMSHEKAWGML